MVARDSIWYFPGDPPLFETLAMLSLFLVTAWGVAWLLMRLAAPRMSKGGIGKLLRALLLLSALPLPVASVGIAHRHLGEWADLKALLRTYADRIEKEVEKRGSDHLAEIGHEVLTPQPHFKFAAFRDPVRLRVLSTEYPYVGVDFGEGAHAVFDPMTMICTYSD